MPDFFYYAAIFSQQQARDVLWPVDGRLKHYQGGSSQTSKTNVNLNLNSFIVTWDVH